MPLAVSDADATSDLSPPERSLIGCFSDSLMFHVAALERKMRSSERATVAKEQRRTAVNFRFPGSIL